MESIDAVCIGHSHSASLDEAARAQGVALEVLNFWHLPGAIAREAEGRVRFAPNLAGRLRAPAFSLIGGAVHYDIGLLLHRPPFDFVAPDAPSEPLVEGAVPVPFGAVRETMRVRSLPYFQIMDALREAVRGPVFQFQSPPVFAQEQVQEHDPGWVAFYGTGRMVAPAPFRRKLWRLQSALIAEHCARLGFVFVPCPAASLTADGYLRPEFAGKPAHANAAYGALLLDQIRAILGAARLPSGAGEG